MPSSPTDTRSEGLRSLGPAPLGEDATGQAEGPRRCRLSAGGSFFGLTWVDTAYSAPPPEGMTWIKFSNTKILGLEGGGGETKSEAAPGGSSSL